MERGEARPYVVTNDCCSASAVFLHAPLSFGEISRHWIEEVRLEHCIVFQQQLLFSGILNVPKVHIVFQFECLVPLKTPECHILGHFVFLRKSVGSMWHNAAVIFNRQNSIEQSVCLSEISGDKILVRVLFFRVVKWVFFLDLLYNLFHFLLGLNFFHHSVINLGRVSLETARKLVIQVTVLSVQLREWLEFEIRPRCEIETLVWELILAVVSQTNGDVVIFSFCALDAAPELELLEVCGS